MTDTVPWLRSCPQMTAESVIDYASNVYYKQEDVDWAAANRPISSNDHQAYDTFFLDKLLYPNKDVFSNNKELSNESSVYETMMNSVQDLSRLGLESDEDSDGTNAGSSTEAAMFQQTSSVDSDSDPEPEPAPKPATPDVAKYNDGKEEFRGNLRLVTPVTPDNQPPVNIMVDDQSSGLDSEGEAGYVTFSTKSPFASRPVSGSHTKHDNGTMTAPPTPAPLDMGALVSQVNKKALGKFFRSDTTKPGNRKIAAPAVPDSVAALTQKGGFNTTKDSFSLTKSGALSQMPAGSNKGRMLWTKVQAMIFIQDPRWCKLVKEYANRREQRMPQTSLSVGDAHTLGREENEKNSKRKKKRTRKNVGMMDDGIHMLNAKDFKSQFGAEVHGTDEEGDRVDQDVDFSKFEPLRIPSSVRLNLESDVSSVESEGENAEQDRSLEDLLCHELANLILAEAIFIECVIACKSARATRNWQRCRIKVYLGKTIRITKVSKMTTFQKSVFFQMTMRKEWRRFDKKGKMTPGILAAFTIFMEMQDNNQDMTCPPEMDALFTICSQLLREVTNEFIEQVIVQEADVEPEHVKHLVKFANFKDSLWLYEMVLDEVIAAFIDRLRITVILPDLETIAHYKKCIRVKEDVVQSKKSLMLTTMETEQQNMTGGTAMGSLTVSEMLDRYSTISEQDKIRFLASFRENAVYDKDLDNFGLDEAALSNAIQGLVVSCGNKMLRKTEMAYLMEMFGPAVVGCGPNKVVTANQYFVIAALAERMGHANNVSCNTATSNIDIYDCEDFSELKEKLKSLWLLNSPNSFGMISLSTLEITLIAGRMDQNSIASIIGHFNNLGCEELDVLDFVAYMPLFNEMHDAVTDQPLSEDTRMLDVATGWFQARKAFKKWRRLVTTRRAAGAWMKRVKGRRKPKSNLAPLTRVTPKVARAAEALRIERSARRRTKTELEKTKAEERKRKGLTDDPMEFTRALQTHTSLQDVSGGVVPGPMAAPAAPGLLASAPADRQRKTLLQKYSSAPHLPSLGLAPGPDKVLL